MELTTHRAGQMQIQEDTVPSSNDPCCNHRQPTEKEMWASDAGLDQAERVFLELARYFFISFSDPSTQAWMQAVSAAPKLPCKDPQANPMELVLDVVQTMRTSRTSCFQFNCPICPTCREILTEQERQFVGTLVAIREGSAGTAHTHAMLLCQGNSTGEFIKAVQRLVSVLPEVRGSNRAQLLRPPTAIDLATTPMAGSA